MVGGSVEKERRKEERGKEREEVLSTIADRGRHVTQAVPLAGSPELFGDFPTY